MSFRKKIVLFLAPGLILLAGCVRSFSFLGSETQPPAGQLCQAADFESSASASDMGDKIALGVTLIYQGSQGCNLSNLPLLTLTDRGGNPLDVRYQAINPTEAPAPPSLEPGDRVVAVAIWQGACGKQPGDGFNIRIEMPGGGRIDAPVAPVSQENCPGAASESIVVIHPFTSPP